MKFKQGKGKTEIENGVVRIISGQQLGLIYWREIV